jgi:hypothetical protein|tara:strand:- start:1197 stop:1433 length:237 start_codon:yes stop_codon:yes gene_type:complete
MCKKLNNWIQKQWTWMWQQTLIDERALAAATEVKKRAKATASEIKDVGTALKEVGNQLGDIDDAVRGKKRRGRKSSKK